MPGDELHREGSPGEDRARTGPRHAAPKKPLLTRLHVPAGKAIAIAAMPTSILMGMGLTPTLAVAKPKPDSPFRDGPCVTQQDKESEEDAEAKEKAKERAAKEKAEEAAKERAEEKTEEPTPSPSGSGDSSDEPTPSPSGSGDSAEPSDEPSPSPSEEESTNPLDPLGLGDKIKDVFTPDDEEEPEPSPSPSESESASSESASTSEDESATDEVTKPVEDTVDGLKDGAKDVTDKAGDTADRIKDAADNAKDSAEQANPLAPDADGKKAFPCVVEKKVDGKDETPPVPIPDDPWRLEASSLLLKGADYQGIVNLKTVNGKTKQAMKYVVKDGSDIGDLHQIVNGPNGTKYHIRADKGTTSTIRDGETVMYTERLSGKLFGLIPVTFDPEHPPPLNIPLIYVTDVEVTQAAQFGGTLKVPGLSQTIVD